MSFDIHGWIEVTRWLETEAKEEYSWQGVVRIGPLLDVPDDVSEKLFGLSKRCVGDGFDVAPFAAGKGLPEYPSAELASDLKAIETLELQYGAGGFGGYTYATWREIKGFALESAVLARSEWSRVFRIAEVLESGGEFPFSDAQIRFIVWYVW